jgi:xanthine dehydrogenase accessory factor
VFDQFLNRANELLAKGQSFAVAIVVRYDAPISGKPGDKAIITVDGKLWGWIGGGCAQPAVIREALKALGDGRARFVRISPAATPGAPSGIVEYNMTCHSGGTLDIFIEPILAKPQILILGRSPVARTLAQLGKGIGYSVSVVAQGADRENFPDADILRNDLNLNELAITPQTFIVVSTQGEQDEEAMGLALSTPACYIAFVASKAKAQKILDSCVEAGATPESVKRVRAPAGLDIRAATPEEIAVSILAQIIQVRSSGITPVAEAKTPSQASFLVREAIDPICGMTVDTTKAKYTSQYQGNIFYFCCSGCKQSFDKQPAK